MNNEDFYSADFTNSLPPALKNDPDMMALAQTISAQLQTTAAEVRKNIIYARMAQFQTVKEGAEEVPYHADGELCRMYTAEEFTALTQAATAHVFYHRTYCNHLNAWIKRAGLDEIPAIVYGADLPADLAASMAALIEKAGGDA